MNQLQFSYSRRITRPSIWRLNPFVYKSDARFVRYGNPGLNPEFTDSYELSYLLYTKVITVTPMIFFRQGHDIISSYSYLADSNVSVTTYRNASGSKSYGLDLVLNSQAVSWINLTGTLSFYNTKFDPDVYSDYSAEEGFTWKGNIRASVTIEKILEIEMSFNSTGKKINAQGTIQPMQQFDVSISKSFLKDKARVAVSAHDLFKLMEWGQEVNAVGYTSIYRSEYDTRVLYLNLSYEFGNTDEYYQKNKKVKRNQNESPDQQDSNGTGK
jgi:hypothetical protein